MINYKKIRLEIPIIEYFESKTGEQPVIKGKHHFYKCIFHEETTPSLTITANPPIFYCFGCAATGDVLDLIKHWEDELNLDNFECKKPYKVAVKPEINEVKVEISQDITQEATYQYVQNLWEKSRGEWAKEFLFGRGFRKGFLREEHIGIGTKYENERITIPVRAVQSSPNNSKEFLKILDIRGYRPGDQVKNISMLSSGIGKLPFIPLHCRKNIGKMMNVFIVEGEMDALRLAQEDDTSVVISCTCGATSLPSVWGIGGYRKLINNANFIILALDNDHEGINTTEKLIEDYKLGYNGNLMKVNWPKDFKNKGDVSDWLNLYSYRELIELCEEI